MQVMAEDTRRRAFAALRNNQVKITFVRRDYGEKPYEVEFA